MSQYTTKFITHSIRYLGGMNMKGEIWKDIEGYEGLYQVSNMGRVKSLKRTVRCDRGYRIVPERILKGRKNRVGYLQVQLCKDGKVKKCYVHRLVATVFCENPEGYTEVNHIDENKQNNNSQNLEWCSHSYNNRYNDKAKKAGKKLSKPVFSVNKESGLIMFWESTREASRQMGINNGNISACCNGRKKSAGGHTWFYADDDTE